MEINGELDHQPGGKEECVICLDEVETEWRDLACQHRYHKRCIENWIVVSARCPLCMKYIKVNKTEERNINDRLIEETHYITARRFIILICVIICVIIVTVICSS